MLEITTRRKMLQACRIAYTIDDSQAVAPAAVDRFDWLPGTPAVFVGGDDQIDAALLFETATDIILAFRGTLPFSQPDTWRDLRDWCGDAEAGLLDTAQTGLPGRVHAGFFRALQALWPAILPALSASIGRNPGKAVYLTGHSKGGAVANLAAMRVAALLHPVAPQVITFAAAKPGDDAFRAAYAQRVASSLRYEFQDDVVPHLPPGLSPTLALPGLIPLAAGFAPVGRLQFIDWNTPPGIVEDSPPLSQQRSDRLASLLGSGRLARIAGDHRIDPGSGYDLATR